jgi:hypothetical protein
VVHYFILFDVEEIDRQVKYCLLLINKVNKINTVNEQSFIDSNVRETCLEPFLLYILFLGTFEAFQHIITSLHMLTCVNQIMSMFLWVTVINFKF